MPRRVRNARWRCFAWTRTGAVVLCVGLLAAALLGPGVAMGGGGPNPLRVYKPGFEPCGATCAPCTACSLRNPNSVWKYSGLPATAFDITRGQFRYGVASLFIDTGQDRFCYFGDSVYQWLPGEAVDGRTYRVNVWTKHDIGGSPHVALEYYGTNLLTRTVATADSTTHTWTLTSVQAKAPPGASFAIALLLDDSYRSHPFGMTARTRAYFDDVSVEDISAELAYDHVSLPDPPYYIGEKVHATYRVRNLGGVAGTWPIVSLAARVETSSEPHDFGWASATLGPGQSKTIEQSQTLTHAGRWFGWVSCIPEGGAWTDVAGPKPAFDINVRTRDTIGLPRPTTPSTVKAKRYFTTSGAIAPVHKPGSSQLKLQFYRLEHRKWHLRKTVSAMVYSNAFPSLYSARVKLAAGRWRVRARHSSDPQGTGATSSYRTFTVK
jgi:hypothetical protein